ncbi:hypothetical protein PISMIDRAFT_96731 [Pisolithus microcarpus 441]|uniref:Uncharacterized protein n=1 Tax=Pisolithus microcarpus 441 TaxID=765257 RepID=A0A0C9Z7P2_9AGAM|nr:hypothetical protein BKA83DRAFT_96731 [Pisolithus microcarpus]KIK25376.1 hypothetical protein PISMIDRAFT_96731 [Pisolithus microcarpus 441]
MFPFKKCCALEEVQCLNIEIHCPITYIQDRGQYLCRCEEQVRATNAINTLLAHQISICCSVHGHFSALHIKYLYNISQLPGFTGMLTPGISTLKAIGDSVATPSVTIPM